MGWEASEESAARRGALCSYLPVSEKSERCDDCIFYHVIQAFRLGVNRAEQEESLNVALVVGGSIVIPHLRRAYELLEELYG